MNNEQAQQHDDMEARIDAAVEQENHDLVARPVTEDEYHEMCGGSLDDVPPTQEEIDEMAEEQERLAAARREEESRAPRAVPGSYDQPFKCEDDLPAPIFATVQTALAGRSTLTSLEQIAFIRALETHGLTLTVLDYPHPTKPFFLLQLVSTHLRPASGWYVY